MDSVTTSSRSLYIFSTSNIKTGFIFIHLNARFVHYTYISGAYKMREHTYKSLYPLTDDTVLYSRELYIIEFVTYNKTY